MPSIFHFIEIGLYFNIQLEFYLKKIKKGKLAYQKLNGSSTIFSLLRIGFHQNNIEKGFL